MYGRRRRMRNVNKKDDGTRYLGVRCGSALVQLVYFTVWFLLFDWSGDSATVVVWGSHWRRWNENTGWCAGKIHRIVWNAFRFFKIDKTPFRSVFCAPIVAHTAISRYFSILLEPIRLFIYLFECNGIDICSVRGISIWINKLKCHFSFSIFNALFVFDGWLCEWFFGWYFGNFVKCQMEFTWKFPIAENVKLFGSVLV